MSRVGYKPIPIPKGVDVDVKDGTVEVKGSKETLNVSLPPKTSAAVAGDVLRVDKTEDSREARALHGLARSLINNMVIGVTEGFKKRLEIIGVGYRAQVGGKTLTLNVGYSKPKEYQIPEGVKVSVEENTKIVVEGADKQLVGEVAATIRRFRKPEPYKGKGIRYEGEHVVIKEGKSVG